MNKFYITTAIDYVNDTIHIGHAFQKVLADVLARYYRIKLGKENVFFLTGTDEYGQKAQKAAELAGVDTKDYVNKISKTDQEQQNALNISYDRFILTTDQDHAKVAQEVWRRVEKNGDIYLGDFSGLYCSGCEAYYTKGDLVENKCPYHPTLEIQQFTEKNFFFKWSKYQDFLVKHIEDNPNFVFPESRRQEMLEFAKSGIQDIPVSRTSFNWGVPVPDHPGHVEYVWFDALTNYLTGVGFLEDPEQFSRFWPADIHILGKDNARWHALLWPAMLKSAGIELPKTILVNGFLSLNGQKISKSIGNVIRPTDWVSKFGVDAVRYYLLRYTTATEDSDISEEKIHQSYNSDLANGLGNLISRLTKLVETHKPYLINEEIEPQRFTPQIEASLLNYRFDEALNEIWTQISSIDKTLNDWEPWKKTDIEKHTNWTKLIKGMKQIAYDLQPFLPETAEKIVAQFSGEIKSSTPLFPRI